MNVTTCDAHFIYGKDQLESVVDHMYQHMNSCKIFCFVGDLGAGKTTLVKKLLDRCGIKEDIVSPTFTLVNTYKNNQNIFFHHFDLYRIGSIDEFVQAGFNEYLHETNSRALIEWPRLLCLCWKNRYVL